MHVCPVATLAGSTVTMPGAAAAVPAPQAIVVCAARLLSPDLPDVATLYTGKLVMAIADKVSSILMPGIDVAGGVCVSMKL